MIVYLLMISAMISAVIFLEMEAEFLHRRVWHGRLMFIHKSHHAPRKGRFESNDALSFIHAPIAIVLIFYGVLAADGILSVNLGVLPAFTLGFGIGMTIFGVGYILVHDGFVHKRLPVQFLGRFAYVRQIRDAHLVHHKWSLKGHPFGLFFGVRVLKQKLAAKSQGMAD